jgi:2-amino-4-hydroxy-6-hydroxymethyldihydropteridine diphosphokinase
MHQAVILMGTNTGDLLSNINTALTFIKVRCGAIINKSSVYRTEPWGKTDQPFFLNQVLILETKLTVKNLLKTLLQIEHDMGRERTEKWAPRLIDLDILFYDDLITDDTGLTIPHPHLHERRFTLQPLAEVLPHFIHPVFNKTVQQLLSEVRDTSDVTVLTPLARSAN